MQIDAPSGSPQISCIAKLTDYIRVPSEPSAVVAFTTSATCVFCITAICIVGGESQNHDDDDDVDIDIDIDRHSNALF